MVVKQFVIALFSLLLAAPAVAGSAQDDLLKNLGLAKSVQVTLEDSVTDNCWPRPNATKATVEKLFLTSGIPVKDDALGLQVNVSAFGFRVKNKRGDNIGCVTTASVDVYYFQTVKTVGLFSVTDVFAKVQLWNKQSMVLGSNGQQNGIDSMVTGWANEIIVLWLKAKQN